MFALGEHFDSSETRLRFIFERLSFLFGAKKVIGNNSGFALSYSPLGYQSFSAAHPIMAFRLRSDYDAQRNNPKSFLIWPSHFCSVIQRVARPTLTEFSPKRNEEAIRRGNHGQLKKRSSTKEDNIIRFRPNTRADSFLLRLFPKNLSTFETLFC